MKGNQPFVRKVIYYCLIAVLLVPLSCISRPATTKDEGGTLSRMRHKHRLSQSNLGEIDPAGATMSLATLGMRGVAANVLWGRAYHYKNTENWDNLKATLNQITKLQPNFLSVWQFQAWNMSYNVSVEFDDYRHRYHWVKKGIDYLIEGTRYNRDEPRLLWEIGWFFGHKMGRADERVQYRRLFKEDTDYQKDIVDSLPIRDNVDINGPDGRPDTWLMAYQWYRAGQVLVETKALPITKRTELLFYSDAPMALMYYADAIENDGYLDEKGQTAWRNAGKAWDEYGDRTLRTSYGIRIRLNELEESLDTIRELGRQLDELAPGVRQKITDEKRGKLLPEEIVALDTPRDELGVEQIAIRNSARQKTRVSEDEIADRAPPNVRRSARQLARRVKDERRLVEVIQRYRGIVNFEYWRVRCKAEQGEMMISARKHLLEALRHHDDAALESARAAYEKAWDEWAEIYQKYPLLQDDVEAEDVVEAVYRYRDLLEQFEETFPPPGFKLSKLMEMNDPDFQPLYNVAPSASSEGSSDGVPDEILPPTPDVTEAGPDSSGT